MLIISFTFIVNLTINLITELHHECKKKKYNSLYFKNTKKLLVY